MKGIVCLSVGFNFLTNKIINMKHFKWLYMTAFFFCMMALPSMKSAAFAPVSDSTTAAQTYATIINRIAEIQNMELQSLSATEKRQLKKELKGLKRSADGLDRRVYLSLGAIIIIILLLILIL